jgi:cellobiose-specific phosphotransferase system component IIB
MAQVSIDVLEPKKSLIDLDSYAKGNFGIGDDFKLTFLFDDIVLVEYIDEINDGTGDAIVRNGVYVPVNALIKAWRKAKVILVGPSVRYCKKDDIVIFPNDKGASVSNIEVEGYGKLKKGVFLNEQRLFGICTNVNANSTSPQVFLTEDDAGKSSKSTKRKRL